MMRLGWSIPCFPSIFVRRLQRFCPVCLLSAVPGRDSSPSSVVRGRNFCNDGRRKSKRNGTHAVISAPLASLGTSMRRLPAFGALPAMLFLIAAIPPARADDIPPPPLKHGVSLSNWFTDSGRQPLTARDFDQIRAAGFDHVRIPINPESLGFSLYESESGRVLFDFSNLDAAIGMARDHG